MKPHIGTLTNYLAMYIYEVNSHCIPHSALIADKPPKTHFANSKPINYLKELSENTQQFPFA